jgi:hypothetical protein
VKSKEHKRKAEVTGDGEKPEKKKKKRKIPNISISTRRRSGRE